MNDFLKELDRHGHESGGGYVRFHEHRHGNQPHIHSATGQHVHLNEQGYAINEPEEYNPAIDYTDDCAGSRP